MEPATNRINRLLEILSSYSFNLYYIKGKDVILSDFLSRQLGDDSEPHQIIPISFNIKEILEESYQNIVKDTYMVQTRSQTKAKAAHAPAVQSTTKKPVTQNIIPRVDKIPNKTSKDSKPNINTQTQLQNTVVNQQFPQGLVGQGNIQIPISTHPSVRLPPKHLDTVGEGAIPNPNLVQNPNVDFEKNSPHQEGIITEVYINPNQSYIEQPQELTNLVNTSKLVQKYLPRQADIDKILDIIKKKVLKGTHLPLTIKSIILLDSLLFKLVTIPDKEKAFLAIPEICADKIIELYHRSLFYRTPRSDKNLPNN